MGCGNIVTNTIVPSNIIEPDKNLKKSQLIENNEQFQIIKKLGEGTNGQVFLIKSKKTQNEYALKAIITKNLPKPLIKKIKEEVNNLKKLDHPNIISFKCAFESNEKTELLNIITEYADNGDLEIKLNENHKKNIYFNENQLLDWLIQSCLAINYLHNNSIIHRDIKPSNIFLMKNNTIKLGDFGVSKNISSLRRTKTVIGTPLYLAPELIQNQEYSFEVDIWSLGVTFCHMMTLEFPFEGRKTEKLYENILQKNMNKKILNKENNNYNENILKNYSKDFINLIDELMSINPKDRPTAKQILEKNIINERMKSFLKENNFDLSLAESSIQNYENKEKDEIVKDNFEIDSNKNNKMPIIIQEMKKDEEKKNGIKEEENPNLVQTMEEKINKNKKTNYDFLRQMTFLHQLHRANTQQV